GARRAVLAAARRLARVGDPAVGVTGLPELRRSRSPGSLRRNETANSFNRLQFPALRRATCAPRVPTGQGMRITRGIASDRLGSHTSPAALTIGNFDGVHRAHRAMLERTVEAAVDLSLTPTV